MQALLPALLILVFVAASVSAIMHRGPWYDEFYSFYLVRPDAPLSALVPAWLRDNHPPLFYAVAWLWTRFLGLFGLAGTVEASRTVNLVVLGAAVLLLWRMARTDRWFRRVVWYDCLALAATAPAIDRIDQLRSYFLSFALTALILPLLARRLRDDATVRKDNALLTVLLLLGFSLHLVTTVILAGVVCAGVVAQVCGRQWRAAVTLAVIAALALIPFAVTMALQLATIEANTRVFWIPPGLNAARWAIESETLGVLAANPVLGLLALGGTMLMLTETARGDRQSRQALALIAALGGGLALALGLLVAVHLHRPMLITRYLVAVDPVLALIVAVAAERLRRCFAVPALVALDLAVFAGSVLAIQANLAATIAQPSWDGTGRAIAALVRACPDSAIHPDLRWNTMPLTLPPRDNREVIPFSYDFVAQRFGFAIAPGHRVSAQCPTVFWTEHASEQHPTAQAVIAGLRRSGYAIASGRMIRIGNGWILITPPAAQIGAGPVNQVANQAGRHSRTIASRRSTWSIGVNWPMPCPRLNTCGRPAKASSTARVRSSSRSPPASSSNGSRLPCTGRPSGKVLAAHSGSIVSSTPTAPTPVSRA